MYYRGIKAFTSYLGENKEDWKLYDPVEFLRSNGSKIFDSPILIDVGTADSFLEGQLLPGDMVAAANEVQQELELRYQEGYDHSYFFISTFMNDHIKHHAKYLL